MQLNDKQQLQTIMWASKKLTDTEKRYAITEKEMYVVVFGMKKFEYELRGRRFVLETDHKALEEIRNKPNFSNARINRWIETIQEFILQYVMSKEKTWELLMNWSRIDQNEHHNTKFKGRIAKAQETNTTNMHIL